MTLPSVKSPRNLLCVGCDPFIETRRDAQTHRSTEHRRRRRRGVIISKQAFGCPSRHPNACFEIISKSPPTASRLRAGLYLPTEGRITLDPEQWRCRISAGFPDHARFEFLVRETVGIADLSALDHDDAVIAALERAGAADLLDALPAGLDTQLGPSWPGGIDLSGGQWQKLAIGRAMMRIDPLLLLLDEPTAALDADTEHQLFERWTAVARRLRQATGAVTVLVSHRFSTVRMADLVVVLDQGQVVEMGQAPRFCVIPVVTRETCRQHHVCVILSAWDGTSSTRTSSAPGGRVAPTTSKSGSSPS
ncbi:MAG TPA: ABC transporter ATP-binding protein [Chloroflexota bacterium]|nr:ABC transporter ATP-binding protein [Chloroflexota bacterium]